jgi:hypothetical protein
MTHTQLKDAIGEAVLEAFNLEIRSTKIPPGEPTYVINVICMISGQASCDGGDEPVGAMLAIAGDLTWNTAISLMQASKAEVEIRIKFAQKRTEPSRCMIQ